MLRVEPDEIADLKKLGLTLHGFETKAACERFYTRFGMVENEEHENFGKLKAYKKYLL